MFFICFCTERIQRQIPCFLLKGNWQIKAIPILILNLIIHFVSEYLKPSLVVRIWGLNECNKYILLVYPVLSDPMIWSSPLSTTSSRIFSTAATIQNSKLMFMPTQLARSKKRTPLLCAEALNVENPFTQNHEKIHGLTWTTHILSGIKEPWL